MACYAHGTVSKALSCSACDTHFEAVTVAVLRRALPAEETCINVRIAEAPGDRGTGSSRLQDRSHGHSALHLFLALTSDPSWLLTLAPHHLDGLELHSKGMHAGSGPLLSQCPCPLMWVGSGCHSYL